jgi:hypothetical protein
MLKPEQVTRLIGWFHVMEENDHPYPADIELLKVITEMLKDAKGRESKEVITFKQYYKYLTKEYIPQMEKLHGIQTWLSKSDQ